MEKQEYFKNQAIQWSKKDQTKGKWMSFDAWKLNKEWMAHKETQLLSYAHLLHPLSRITPAEKEELQKKMRQEDIDFCKERGIEHPLPEEETILKIFTSLSKEDVKQALATEMRDVDKSLLARIQEAKLSEKPIIDGLSKRYKP